MDSKYWLLIIAFIVIIAISAQFFTGKEYERIQIAGSTSVQPVAEKLAEKFQETHPKVKINVQGGGSGLGIRTVEQGIVNIGMSSKELKDNEKDGLKEYIIGKDGIVIGVNQANPIEGLSKSQLKDIFSGKITNWNQVGGNDVEIHVVVRESGSGTMQGFQDLVMGKTKIRQNAIVQSSTESVKQAIKQDPGAIGFVSLAHMSSDIKALQIDGVLPSESTVASGAYKLQRPFIFLVKGEPKGEIKVFIDWVLGPEGQAIVSGEKVVPIK
jgi:phosphate transport system substrate-binding protein